MCDPVSAIIGSAVVGAGTSLYSGAKARKQANKAQASNEAIARQQAQRAEEQFNRLNQKQPGVEALYARNAKVNSGGVGSTFLTGTTGAKPLLGS
jgi:regulator of protease activity HflC (stomatin/prohibitin superfamily)